ncbi:MAG TPA: hypothetical protein PLD20_31605 [Blastocatellia bacterium]|nr:hypothetical protein [Blastocatellia bacterium]HMV86081.1 hypothetical protein [Blastocatellia bacterium]HMX28250.1 hypothetical protein [Blastocatellia bacterium]HMZ22519.1 hypothetical protein [Blastocatellia bacterium]HNG31973.1 hypothetical protein [Blastocatellia bacterium]
MYAVEFQTQITNGEIQLPNEWKGKLSGLVRIIVLTETEPSYRNGADFWKQAELLANQSAAERGLQMLREASQDQAEITASWAMAMKEMGISGEAIGAEELRARMIAEGINPEDNEFSRGIIEMREE